MCWGTEYKKEPIAFGIFKLIIGFSLEDEKVSVDDVVAIELPDRPGIFYVKRISKIDYEKQAVYLLSDNPEGTDSRQWGWLAVDTVKAKVLLRVRSSKEK